MKKFRQFQVGTIVLHKENNRLVFNGAMCAENPVHVVLAMVAAARYMQWLPIDLKRQNDEKIVQVSSSKSGRTLYINNQEVMDLCSTGNTDWACLTKSHLQGLVSNYNLGKGTEGLIPENTLEVVPMLLVSRMKPKIIFEEEDFLKADELFFKFMEKYCPVAGEYEFEMTKLIREIGLPTEGLVWHYLTNRFAEVYFNGKEDALAISSAVQEGDTIRITVG